MGNLGKFLLENRKGLGRGCPERFGVLEVSKEFLDIFLGVQVGIGHGLDSMTLEFFPNLQDPGLLKSSCSSRRVGAHGRNLGLFGAS